MPSKPAEAPPQEVINIGALAPTPEPLAHLPAVAVANAPLASDSPELEVETTKQQSAGIVEDSPRAEAIAATEAMPWLFADPGASQPVGGAAHASVPQVDGSTPADEVGRRELAPSAVPYVAGHTPRLDPAGVLESIAARIRAGAIDASAADASGGEAAVLAAVLVSLLRQQGR